MVKKQHIILSLFLTLVGTLILNVATKPAFAASSTFVVNSVADLPDADNGDGICETTNAGECTFRAAVQQANTNSNPLDQDVINFTIVGAGVHTIELAGSAVVISQSVLINGYTQPGSSVNTQAWPAAMDSVLQIEVDMSNLSAGGSGINLNSTADDTTIKGLVLNNATSGVITTDPGADGFELEGNYINTDITGLLPTNTATSSHAVYLSGANSTVGGSNAAQRNVITSRGISVGTGGTGGYILKGNNINVGSDSVTPFTQDPLFGSSVAVVSVSGTNNQIGGSVAGEGNTISGGKLYNPLSLSNAHSTTIKGNHIVDNDGSGVYVNSTSDSITIGGSLATERNIVSGNGGDGISVSPGASDVTIKGNYIGVDEDGVTPFANLGSGISSFGDNTTIGGSAAGEGNVISGNAVSGIILAGNNLTIRGNYIGVASNGTSSVGNGAMGIQARVDSSSVTIGGSAAGEGNVISGNSSYGIHFSADTGSITGNKIGVGSDGTTSIANDNSGIFVTVDASDTIIGGVGAGYANTIANNGADGVTIDGNSSILTNTTPILGNSIFDNTDLAIDLGSNNVTNNDMLDPDTGPNDFLNYPVLHEPYEVSGNTELAYTIDVPAGEYRVEFYENTVADPTGHGEGKTLIGVDSVVSLGASLYVTETLNTVGHTNISATITEIDGETTSGYGATSEFSGESETELDVAVTKMVVDQSTIIDGTISYDVTYTNNGPQRVYLPQFTVDPGDPLNTALFNDIFSDNLTFISATGDAECSTQNPAADFNPLFSNHSTYAVLSCGYDGPEVFLEEGEAFNFTLNFTVVDTFETVFTNYLLSVPLTEDTSRANYQLAVDSNEDIIDELGTGNNNLASATTTKPITDISVTKELTNPEDIAKGATLNYQITFTNEGPDSLDLDEFNGVPPLLFDVVHPDLTPSDLGDPGPFEGTFFINDTGNPNIACLWAGPGSVATYLPNYTDHSDYGLISCFYVVPNSVLANDADLQMDLNFTVANDSDLAFTNYVLTSTPTPSTDPDENILGSLSGDGITSITSQYPSINNFAMAELPADIDVSATLENSGDISPGDSVYYDVTLKNNGNTGIDLSTYNNLSTKTLIAAAYPAEDLALVGSATTNVLCASAGPGSMVYLNNGGNEHFGHQLSICTYTGASQIIAPGESYVVRLRFTATSDVTNSFNLYAFQGSVYGDPDMNSLYTDLYGASGDVLDTLVNENYARVAYIGSGASEEVIDNTLSETGQNRKILAVIAGLVVLGGAVATGSTLFIRRKKSLH